MSHVTLSLVVPVFNPGPFLFKAVQSILREGLRGVEILLIDDGSEASALETLAAPPIIRYFRQKNGGPAAALNTGISLARGEYIAFLDQDDAIAAGGLRWRLNWLASNPTQLAIFGTVAGVIDTKGHFVGSWKKIFGTQKSVPKFLTRDFFESNGDMPCTTSLFMYRRSFLKRIGEFDESLRRAHDREFLFRALEKAPIRFQNRPVFYYRIHSQNQSLVHFEGRSVLSSAAIAERWLVDQTLKSLT